MKEPVRAEVRLINDGVRLMTTFPEKSPIEVDSNPPYGAGDTLSAMQLFLTSLCSCSGGTVLALLHKMRKTISAFSIHAQGTRREEPPTSYETISLSFHLVSPNTTEEEFLKVIRLTEEKYCPVWAMIKGSVSVDISAEVTAP